eukprot:m.20200 g.20200  ORF g.20200 m.20200 type:complete len:175 (-) comp11011_c0_seq1:64-588(-)
MAWPPYKSSAKRQNEEANHQAAARPLQGYHDDDGQPRAKRTLEWREPCEMSPITSPDVDQFWFKPKQPFPAGSNLNNSQLLATRRAFEARRARYAKTLRSSPYMPDTYSLSAAQFSSADSDRATIDPMDTCRAAEQDAAVSQPSHVNQYLAHLHQQRIARQQQASQSKVTAMKL